MSDKDYSPHETWCDTQNKIAERCNCIASSYIDSIEDLKAKLDLAVEALEFYSKAHVWGCDMQGRRTAIDPCDQEELELRNEKEFFKDVRGGKKARQALAKIKGSAG